MDIKLSPSTIRHISRYALAPENARVLVTGATGSLGRYTCAALCLLGARLVLPARDMVKGEALRYALIALCPDADVTLEQVDMSDPASVQALAARLCARGEAIDIIINNAGVFTRAGIRAPSGAELHEQVNALSPLALTRALLPLMAASPKPRVVTVTSLAAWNARLDARDSLALRSATEAYGRSKLMLTRGMAKLGADDPSVTFVFAHPGISATNLFHAGKSPSAYAARLMRVLLPIMRRVFMKPEKAALCTVCAACADLQTLDMCVPRGLMEVWGYPRVRRLWKRVTRGDEQGRCPCTPLKG